MVPSRPDLSSEASLQRRADLLRLCCAISTGDADLAWRRVMDRKGNIDWLEMIEVAKSHRIEMFLYRAVDSRFAKLAGPSAHNTLRSLYAHNLVRCRGLTDQLHRLLRRLTADGIPALAFKGPVLGAQIYGDVALRTYADLDILVRHGDVAQVTRVMLDMGYAAGMPLAWEMSFTRPAGEGVEVDLHWSLAEKIHQFPRTTDELFARSIGVDVAGTAVQTLCAEDALLAVCFNGLTEDWQRCDRIADVAEILRRSSAIDWPAFLHMCRKRGCERIVLLALHLAKELFLADLPQCVERRLQSHRSAIRKAGYGIEDFTRFVITSTTRRQGMDAWRYLLRMREGQWARIPYYQSLAYNLFTPKDADAPWQRTSRHVLYAILRLPLLAVKRGLRVLGHANLKETEEARQ
jgi:hypothetical protein